MVDQAQRGDLQEVEGWTTDSPEELVWFMKSAGRWNVWQQIKVDARSWKPRMMWALCVVPLAVGWLVPLWYGRERLVTFGIFAGMAYVFMLLNVVRGYRVARLVEGTVARFDGTHPLCGWIKTGSFIPKGSAQPTATVILAEWAVKKFVYPGMELQVLAFVSPSQELSRVVGVRSPVRLG